MSLRAVSLACLVVSCADPAAEPAADATSELPLSLVDITELSPELSAHPFGGQPGWDHSDKYSPGVALADLDGDGLLDLVQPRNDRADEQLRSLRLFRGVGAGRFQEVEAPQWDVADNAVGVLTFDFDGDGDLDLFVAVDGGPSKLYRNDGQWVLVDVAEQAGVDLPGVRAFTAAAGDYDGDSDLDLYVGAWNASAQAHGDGTAPNWLLRNNGDGTFTDVTEASGVACHGWATLGVVFADLDGDADLELFVVNDFFDACLYENLGEGQFADVAAAAGVLHGAFNGMGIDVGDLNGDGWLDVMVTDDEVVDDSRGNAVYINRGNGALQFDSRAIELGLDGIITLSADWLVCWGVGLVDLDLDGDLDVHVSTHGQRLELVWRQDRTGEFVPERALISSLADVDGRGTAYGDIDSDGDLDVVVARRGAGLQVLRNDSTQGGFLVVVAQPGAVVRVTAGGRQQVAPVMAGSGYASAGPPTVTFGLGGLDRVERVEVRFPDGRVEQRDDVAAGTTLRF